MYRVSGIDTRKRFASVACSRHFFRIFGAQLYFFDTFYVPTLSRHKTTHRLPRVLEFARAALQETSERTVCHLKPVQQQRRRRPRYRPAYTVVARVAFFREPK